MKKCTACSHVVFDDSYATCPKCAGPMRLLNERPDSPISKPEELVALARALRAEGCIRAKWGDLELEMLHPPQVGLSRLSDEIADLPAEQREELLSTVKRQLDADLYGASG